MSPLEIQLASGRSVFRPGETLAGRLTWDLADRPKTIELRLFWRTEGKGTQDVGVVHRVQVDSPDFRGAQDFSILLPASPYSFSGKLISLIWALEAVVTPGKELARVDLVIASAGGEIVLGSVK